MSENKKQELEVVAYLVSQAGSSATTLVKAEAGLEALMTKAGLTFTALVKLDDVKNK